MDPLTPNALAITSDFMDKLGSGLTILRGHGKKVQKYVFKSKKFDLPKKPSTKSMINVVLVEATDLPETPSCSSNNLYCKFKLGSETHKSKQVSKSKPSWCERFNLNWYDDSNLEITLWLKGKQKNFMGRCTINLVQLEKEKTHDIWQELECGYGSLHVLVTINGTSQDAVLDSIPTNGIHHNLPEEDRFNWYRIDSGWREIGQLTVTVRYARGLSSLSLGRADPYCVLELDNARMQTHVVRATFEPVWNKSYVFGINDITSALDVTVYDESIINSMKGEMLGRVSIPLLRINNNEDKWYALKDRSQKTSAKGNCPRILLHMSIVWNPIKASLRVLSPKEIKYTQKPAKFNIPLIYSNLKFIKDIFDVIYIGHEHFKRLFEWENREISAIALTGWLVFWYTFRVWMAPLLLILPFLYHWVAQRQCSQNVLLSLPQSDEESSEDDLETQKDEKTIKTRLYGLQDLTLTIKNGIDYIVSLLERLHNLVNFTVPYLSCLAIIALIAASVGLYFIPINYIFMAFGIYKFTRKFLNPKRIPNNDILDFLSRVPDNEILKRWRELKVPEPNFSRTSSIKRT